MRKLSTLSKGFSPLNLFQYLLADDWFAIYDLKAAKESTKLMDGIGAARAHLPKVMAVATELVFDGHKTLKEAAGIMGCSRTTVRRAILDSKRLIADGTFVWDNVLQIAVQAKALKYVTPIWYKKRFERIYGDKYVAYVKIKGESQYQEVVITQADVTIVLTGLRDGYTLKTAMIMAGFDKPSFSAVSKLLWTLRTQGLTG